MSDDRVMELRLSTTIVYFDLRGMALSFSATIGKHEDAVSAGEAAARRRRSPQTMKRLRLQDRR